MQLWAASILFIVCALGAAVFIKLYGKSKKAYFIALAAITSLLALALLAYSALTLTLLGGAGDAPVEPVTESGTQVTPITDGTAGVTDPAITLAADDDAIVTIEAFIDRAIEIINADRRDNLSTATFGYERKSGYDILNEADKAMYDEMLQKARAFTPFSYTAAEHGYEVMDRSLIIYGAIKDDHPEIENYFMLRDVVDGDVTTALEALYFMPWDAEQKPADAEALREETERFDAICERIAERMPGELSAYDKYRYLATVISYATSYDYDYTGGWQDATAYGSIAGGYSICQGYSRGFMYLCGKAGLWCETVAGVAGDNYSHMWNMVKLDGGTYFVDITWSDELGLPGSPEWDGYFMLTQDEILKDHEITDGSIATGTQIR